MCEVSQEPHGGIEAIDAAQSITFTIETARKVFIEKAKGELVMVRFPYAPLCTEVTHSSSVVPPGGITSFCKGSIEQTLFSVGEQLNLM